MTEESTQKTPGVRGALAAIKEGIKTGREEARREHEEHTRAVEEYAREHPSDYGKKIGQVVEKAQPVIRPVARGAERVGRSLKRGGAAVKSGAVKAGKAAWQRQVEIHTAAPRSRPRSRPLDPLSGLDGMLIGSTPKRKQQKKRKRSSRPDEDYFGLGGDFRLL